MDFDAKLCYRDGTTEAGQIVPHLSGQGIFIPIRIKRRDYVFELVRVTNQGVLVYKEEFGGPRHIPQEI